MTSLPNRHNPARMPERYRPAFRTKAHTAHQHAFLRTHIAARVEPGRGNAAAI